MGLYCLLLQPGRLHLDFAPLTQYYPSKFKYVQVLVIKPKGNPVKIRDGPAAVNPPFLKGTLSAFRATDSYDDREGR